MFKRFRLTKWFVILFIILFCCNVVHAAGGFAGGNSSTNKPAGKNKQIQFNDNGKLSGSEIEYNKTDKSTNFPGSVSIGDAGQGQFRFDPDTNKFQWSQNSGAVWNNFDALGGGIDWTMDQGATDIHPGNIPSLPYLAIGDVGTILQGYSAELSVIAALACTENQIIKRNGEGGWICAEDGGGAPEADPVFFAWDKSTGIIITESQISDLQAYLTQAAADLLYASIDHDHTGVYQPSDDDLTEFSILDCSEGQIPKQDASGNWVCGSDDGGTGDSWPELEDCSGITSGCCLDTNDGYLYCYDGDSVEEVARPSSVVSIADPNADRIYFWDDSAGTGGEPALLAPDGSTLEISGTTLQAKDGGITEAKMSAGAAAKVNRYHQTAHFDPDKQYASYGGIVVLDPYTPAATTISHFRIRIRPTAVVELTVTVKFKADAADFSGGTTICTGDTASGLLSVSAADCTGVDTPFTGCTGSGTGNPFSAWDNTIPAGSLVWMEIGDDPDSGSVHGTVVLDGSYD
jgi:hypothetical protein